MREILVSNKLVSFVDDDDFDLLMRFKWWLSTKGYAFTHIKRKYTSMHRMVSNPPLGMNVDHINRNKLDNRKSNLRFATTRQNIANSGPRKHNKLGVKGVTWDGMGKKGYMARIRINGVPKYLGRFLTVGEAAEAYANYAKMYYGDFAHK